MSSRPSDRLPDGHISRADLLREFGGALRNGEASVFVGAGLSAAAGYVDWKGLLRDFAEDLHLDLDIESDMSLVAQYHINRQPSRSRERLHEKLVAEFSQPVSPTRSHLAIAELPLDVIWTSNYDSLVEESFIARDKSVRVNNSSRALVQKGKRKDCTVYKLHGDLEDPSTIVLTRDDYRQYVRRFPSFRERLQSDLTERTFLFVGFSFTDPHLDFILNELRTSFGDGQTREHFVIMRREPRSPRRAKWANYERNRQALKVEDLATFGIRTLLVDDFDEVPEILEDLGRRLRRSRIFVSGALVKEAGHDESRSEEIADQLGKRIIQEGFDLVSGFGQGLGPFVVSGALEALYEDDVSSIDRRLRLRPFPHTRSSRATYTNFRNDLISTAGFAVFLGGSKQGKNGKVVSSDGMWEEFEIALQHGLIPLPVGSTGWVARELWAHVRKEWASIMPRTAKKSDFAILGRASASIADVTDAVFRLIRQMTAGQ